MWLDTCFKAKRISSLALKEAFADPILEITLFPLLKSDLEINSGNYIKI